MASGWETRREAGSEVGVTPPTGRGVGMEIGDVAGVPSSPGRWGEETGAFVR